MMDTLGLVAILTCGLFTGASVYINLVEHPARLSCGTEIAATQWAPSYKRATMMQVTLAMLAAIAAGPRGALAGDAAWVSGAILIFAVIPFTVVVILPTNNKLLSPTRDRARPPRRARYSNAGAASTLFEAPSVFLHSCCSCGLELCGKRCECLRTTGGAAATHRPPVVWSESLIRPLLVASEQANASTLQTSRHPAGIRVAC
jgi:hypothetical protein